MNGFKDLAFIDKYAGKFCIDPDIVIKKGFNSVMNFIIMWKEQEEFRERFSNLHRQMSDSNGKR